MTAAVGIVGGYGGAGAEAARLLCGWGISGLRIGGRRPERAAGLVAELGGAAEATAVDVEDAASLARFAAGCAVVVNCAGPAQRVKDRVARAALAAGADLVDAAGDATLYAALDAAFRAAGRAAVLSAGMLPGLSGLLPRWLAARGFDRVTALTAYFGALAPFTRVAAEDYLDGMLDGTSEPLAAWRDGHRSASALRRRLGVHLPFFPTIAPDGLAASPYLDTEAAQVAETLCLTSGRWYTVIDGRHLPVALDQARGLDRAAAVAALCRATALDAAGRTPYATLLVQLDGGAGGRAVTRTAVLRGRDVSALTGAGVALATLAARRGTLPEGVHPFAGVMDPAAVDRLRGPADVTVLDAAIDELAAEEEGVV